MKKLYQRKEMLFAIIWIIIYVVLTSTADSLSSAIGILKIVTAPLHIAMALFLIIWSVKSGLLSEFGLDGKKINFRQYLYFVPLAIICSTNLWGGVTLNYSVTETVLYVASMLCVGFLEEYIFRGLLFGAMAKSGIKSAIIVSSLTFGLGHIVNLLNGAPLVDTLLQICYASAVGFLFTAIYYKCENLLPCIIAHSVVNSLSAFAGERPNGFGIIVSLLIIVISVGYGIFILKRVRTESKSTA